MAINSRLIGLGLFLLSFIVVQSMEERVKNEGKCRYFMYVDMH